MNSLEIWKLLREYIDKNTTLYLKEKTHIETVEGQPLDKIEKSLKALEIIKREPSAVIEIITTYDTWEEYTNDYPLRDKTIWHIIKNKNEFDLLKEIFDE